MAVVLAVLGLAASPFAGTVCTMSCGDGGDCCCEGGTGGEVSYSAPSCCGPEFGAPDGDTTILPDRVAGDSRFAPLGAILARNVPETAGPGLNRASGATTLHGPSPTAAPAFLLNSSFLL